MMMQKVPTTRQLRSTWHSSHFKVCRNAAVSLSRRNYIAIRSSGNNENGTGSMDSEEKNTTVAESISRESDFVFLLRLVGISFAGGAAIKYGSLIAELPFAPNGLAAVAIVSTPPAIYSLWLLRQQGKD